MGALLGPPIALKRRSVLLMIVLTILTLGLYYPVWFLRRRAALNRLESPRKLQLWPFLIFLAFWLLQIVIVIASGPESPEQTIGAGASLLLRLSRLAVGILMVVQCFFIKDILEDHLAGPEAVTLSGLMTFFFQIYYLQYAINRHVVGSGTGAVSPGEGVR